MDKQKMSLICVLILLVFLTSCTSLISMKVPVVPTVELTDVKTVSIFTKSINRVQFFLKVLTNNPDFMASKEVESVDNEKNHYNNTLIASTSLDAKIKRHLMSDNIFIVKNYTPNETEDFDSLIKLSLTNVSIVDTLTDISDLGSREIRGKWAREVSITYIVEISKNPGNEVLFVSEETIKKTTESLGITSRGNLTNSERLIGEAIDEIATTIHRLITPSVKSWSFRLEEDKENEMVVFANKMVQEQKIPEAKKIFLDEWETNRNTVAGINCSVLLFYTGYKIEAIELISQVNSIKNSKLANELLEEFTLIQENENRVSRIGRSKI